MNQQSHQGGGTSQQPHQDGRQAMSQQHLAWPFFEDHHRALAHGLGLWCGIALKPLSHNGSRASVDADCRALVPQLGAGGWTRYAVPRAHGGALEHLDSRALCIIRETLAYHEGLADFAFAMQGLGSGAISLAGSDALKAHYLPRVARGEAIAAFALSEPDAGSDVGALSTSARFESGIRAGAGTTETAAVTDARQGGSYEGGSYILNGTKTWISNGGIADFYCVFARTDATSKGAKGISAFVVDANTPGLAIAERIDVMAPHPLATLVFDNCRVPATQLLGAEGGGFKLAMQTLDIFRASVAAAALGFARRALDEAVAHAKTRNMFGGTLADLQLTQAAIGEMAALVDAAALLTYRAAWQRDVNPNKPAGNSVNNAGIRTTKEAAMAKMTATENAQTVIDRAVQMFGGRGVKSGEVVEKLYREIRALRIYEGATEVQKLIIGRETLKE